MIRTAIQACKTDRALCDQLNRTSGEIYTQVMVYHWRVYRKHGVWLSKYDASRCNDAITSGKTILHSNSIDAAQHAFYNACSTIRALRKSGKPAKFPHKRKMYRTTVWGSIAIKFTGGKIRLSLSGKKYIYIDALCCRDAVKIVEVRLVYDKSHKNYYWHIVYENGKKPKEAPGENIIGVDLGEIHPAAISDGENNFVVTCRELRSQRQNTNKRLADLRSFQSRFQKGSRRYRRIQARINNFLSKQRNRTRDMEHKISRDIVNAAVDTKSGTIAVGDVRDISDGINIGSVGNQKVSNWSHGKILAYIKYKAEEEGIKVKLVNEAYTSQTCPNCGHRHKPRGRRYVCGRCGFSGHRDVIGAVNILSVHKTGAPGNIKPGDGVKYRIPFNKRVMRSPVIHGEMACASKNCVDVGVSST